MKKTLIMTSVALVLLLAVIAAGLNVVFTVTHIDASFKTFSEQGEAEAVTLKKELDEYTGSSTTFLDLSEVEEAVEKYPCFRLEKVEKKFPKTLKVVVSERRELFAYETNGKFAMIDTEGICLRMADENVSRSGGENVLLSNFSFDVTVGQKVEGEYMDALISAFSGFEEYLKDPRVNIREVLWDPEGNVSNPVNNFFKISMREGSVISMQNPLSKPDEKARESVKVYEHFSDVEKLYRSIMVTDGYDGTVNVDPRLDE